MSLVQLVSIQTLYETCYTFYTLFYLVYYVPLCVSRNNTLSEKRFYTSPLVMNQWKFKFQVNKWNHLPLVFRCVVYHGWRACVCVQTTECSTVATVYRLRNRKIAQKKPWVLAQDEGHTIENNTGHTYRKGSKENDFDSTVRFKFNHFENKNFKNCVKCWIKLFFKM